MKDVEYRELTEALPTSPEGKWELGLHNIRRLMELFDNPQDKLPTVHIAGTNGKGSTASMIAKALQEAGYKVGLYTSPSLVRFNERIRINGEEVSDDQLLKTVDRIQTAIAGTDIHFSEFELFTALAWLIFEEEKCDVVVLEVGLGGRLDATNLVKSPVLTVVTKIAYDHQQYLGNTLTAIAHEKAGIIKYCVPLVIYPEPQEAVEVLTETADRLNAPMRKVDQEDIEHLERKGRQQIFSYKGKTYCLNLLGRHQEVNASVALEALQWLQELGFKLSEEAIRKGLSQVNWPGRFEWVHHQPDIVIDGSHNLDGIRALRYSIESYFPSAHRLAIMGMMKDKDVTRMVGEVLPLFEEVITLTPDPHRGMPAVQLAQLVRALAGTQHVGVWSCHSMDEAVDKAYLWSKYQDDDALICVFGSLYLVGDLRKEVFRYYSSKNEN